MPDDTKTLRDEFALAVLAGFTINPDDFHRFRMNGQDPKQYLAGRAEAAYDMADAMLAARAKK